MATAKAATAKKTAPKPRRSTKKPATASAKPDRRSMVAEAAYFRAEKRGFNGSDELGDWLAAESEIDHLLGSN